MDPALEEQIDDNLDPFEEIEAIIRLVNPGQYPPDIRVVSRFGDIFTCRVLRGNIQKVYNNPRVASFKATRVLYHDACTEQHPHSGENKEAYNLFESTGGLTGKGVVIGIIDWGGDFAHLDFVNEDGTSRMLALWDQNFSQNEKSPQPFGYGKVYYRAELNAALKTPSPYKTIGYHPGIGDPKGYGMHGTHVMGTATANGRSGKRGIAPDAEIIFVHLGSGNTDGRFNLGDSCRVLEAIDFIKLTAGEKPLVINISAGKHGGPHDGSTLVEMSIDNFLQRHLNTVICQSTGNYFNTKTHCSGLIKPGQTTTISFITGNTYVTENEIEIWYSGKDEFDITLHHPGTNIIHSCSVGSNTEISFNGITAGWMYHRSQDPNNGRNHVDIFLYQAAPTGQWKLMIGGKKITDGRFHAWIERADQGQSNFEVANIVRTATTNTICNSHLSIVCGAYDQTHPDLRIAPFSSSGPTLDGRMKPHVLAPGIKIRSSKSSPRTQAKGSAALTEMSGTSMASPFITGAVALILEGLTKEAGIYDIRNILFKSCREKERKTLHDKLRGGYGMIDLSLLEENINWFNSQPTNDTIDPDLLLSVSITEEDETELHECCVSPE